MSIPGYKRLTIALVGVGIGLIVVCGSLLWIHGLLAIRVAFAKEQSQIFEEMRTKALQSDAASAAGCLDYLVHYYPSGTKQQTGSPLDWLVEHNRALAERDIVMYLRTKTGQDLGERPEAWVQKYAPK